MAALIFNLVAVPALLILIGYGLRALATRIIPIGMLRFWLYPGVAVHEISHALACIPAMAKVSQVTIFRADGSGEVAHDAPRLRVIGPVMISIAPLIGGPLVLALLNWALGNPLRHEGAVTGDAARSFAFLWVLAQALARDLAAAAEGAVWLDWRGYIMVLTVFSVTLAMIPSGADLKNAAIGAAVTLLLLIACWLAMDLLFHVDAADGLAGAFTWTLGFGHVALLYFALDLLLIGLLALIGFVLSAK